MVLSKEAPVALSLTSPDRTIKLIRLLVVDVIDVAAQIGLPSEALITVPVCANEPGLI